MTMVKTSAIPTISRRLSAEPNSTAGRRSHPGPVGSLKPPTRTSLGQQTATITPATTTTGPTRTKSEICVPSVKISAPITNTNTLATTKTLAPEKTTTAPTTSTSRKTTTTSASTIAKTTAPKGSIPVRKSTTNLAPMVKRPSPLTARPLDGSPLHRRRSPSSSPGEASAYFSVAGSCFPTPDKSAPVVNCENFTTAVAAASTAPESNLLSCQRPTRATYRSTSTSTSTPSLSMLGSALEDKLNGEIRQVQRELSLERERNAALNGQLAINSGLMGAFEQSLATLNSRLHQMGAQCERREAQNLELRAQLAKLEARLARCTCLASLSPVHNDQHNNHQQHHHHHNNHDQLEGNGSCDSALDGHSTSASASGSSPSPSPPPAITTPQHQRRASHDHNHDQSSRQTIEQLEAQLRVKDRQLIDTQLEALTAASQLERLEQTLAELSAANNQQQQHHHDFSHMSSPTRRQMRLPLQHHNLFEDQDQIV